MVRIDSALEFDPCWFKVGHLLRVSGRITGRDIVEPLLVTGVMELDAARGEPLLRAEKVRQVG